MNNSAIFLSPTEWYVSIPLGSKKCLKQKKFPCFVTLFRQFNHIIENKSDFRHLRAISYSWQ